MIKITVGPGQVGVEGDSPELVEAVKAAIAAAIASPASGKLTYKVLDLGDFTAAKSDVQVAMLQKALDAVAGEGWCFDAIQGNVLIVAKRA